MSSLILFLTQLGIFSQLEARECFVEKKTFVDGDFFVESRFYPHPESGKTILIIPPTGGTNLIDRSYARELCAVGFNVHILDHWTMDDEYSLDLDIHRRFYGRAQRAIDLILTHIPEQHEVSVLGTSVGALHASIATGRVERIKKALFITGGADITGTIVDSDQDVMRVARKKRNEMFGFKTRDEYYNELKKHIVLDPLFFESSFPGKKVSMVISDKDQTVPGPYQRLLQKISRPSRVLEINDDHFWAITKTWLFHKDFVKKSFL